MQTNLQEMDRWYETPTGALLADMEAQLIRRFVTHTFGEVLVQMGGKADMSLTQASEMPRRFYVGPEVRQHCPYPQVQAALDELPLSPGRIDLIVCAHMLEFTPSPQVALKALYDSLKPQGLLILFGFNAFSLWGLTRWKQRKTPFPWTGQFYSVLDMRRMMRQAGFSVLSAKTVCFRPPGISRPRARHLLFLEAIGQTLCPGLGGAYMMTAQKRVIGMTPVRKAVMKKIYRVETGVAG